MDTSKCIISQLWLQVNVLLDNYSCNSMGHLSIMATYQYITCQCVNRSMCHQSVTVTSQCISCYYVLKSLCHLSASQCIWFVSMAASQCIISQLRTQVNASPGSSGYKSMQCLQDITPMVDTLLRQYIKTIYSQLKELTVAWFRHKYLAWIYISCGPMPYTVQANCISINTILLLNQNCQYITLHR